MSIRRTQIVLITFAVASWLGAVLELGAAVGCGGDDTEGNTFRLTQGQDSSRQSVPRASPASPSAAR